MNKHKILVRKPDGKRSLGRPRLVGITVLKLILQEGDAAV
jgi:hypothetical protein